MRNELALYIALSSAGLTACVYEAPSKFSEPLTLGGEVVSAEVLNEGLEVYGFYCISCHGTEGDGRGLSSPGLPDQPRDFRTASFKFGGVVDGLPHDSDLEHVVRYGLEGTAMVPWKLTDRQLSSVIHYIKTFSPPGEGWRDSEEERGERIEVGADPWSGREGESIEAGEAVFHGAASCDSCHPTYVTRTKAATLKTEESAPAPVEPGPEGAEEAPPAAPEIKIRQGAWMSVPQYSPNYTRPMEGDPSCSDDDACGEDNVCRYGRCELGTYIVPPDFTVSAIKTGTELSSIARVLSTGVAGTPMPAWDGVLSEEEIWALAHYVQSLALMDSGDARRLRAKVKRSMDK
jgi:mono/diheme cytochrome c family protein